MTKEEALKLALDALSDFDYDKRMVAINVIKEALAQPAQELQNFCPRCGKRTPNATDVHTCTPPQRPWVGLTEEEWTYYTSWVYPEVLKELTDKLKEKNS